MAKMMSCFHQLQVATIAVLLFVAFPSVTRADPDMLQDICVADLAAAFNSQLQGTQSIANTLFASTPPVADDILAKAFQIDNEEVKEIKAKLAPKT
ncbi:nectarin-1-like protein [Carex littledalei]|uniref:Nectarin-1-like protein n=1 Tax=Carex littledalei TaxID=544730 RepID=A0A833VG04_9POAL|nr:nectarin-1-like protein [Carex littledalei]